MQKELNLKIKFRESFRPFAPSVLREDVSEWFELNDDSPYMLLVSDIISEKKIDNEICVNFIKLINYYTIIFLI